MPPPYGQTNAVLVHYDENGAVAPGDEEAILSAVTAEKLQHLFVISHGWNNDQAAADLLYTNFFRACDNVWSHVPEIVPSTCLALAVIWPSQKFDEQAFAAAESASGAGVAATGQAAAITDDVDTRLLAQLASLKTIAPFRPRSIARSHSCPRSSWIPSRKMRSSERLRMRFPRPRRKTTPASITGSR